MDYGIPVHEIVGVDDIEYTKTYREWEFSREDPRRDVEERLVSEVVWKHLNSLDGMERDFLVDREINLKYYKDCAPKYNLSGERARQIILKALRRLRHPKHLRIFEMVLYGIDGQTIKEREKREEEMRRARYLQQAKEEKEREKIRQEQRGSQREELEREREERHREYLKAREEEAKEWRKERKRYLAKVREPTKFAKEKLEFELPPYLDWPERAQHFHFNIDKYECARHGEPIFAVDGIVMVLHPHKFYSIHHLDEWAFLVEKCGAKRIQFKNYSYNQESWNVFQYVTWK